MKKQLTTTVAGALGAIILSATAVAAMPRSATTVTDGSTVRGRAATDTFVLDRRFPVGGSASIIGFVNQEGLTQTTFINGGVRNTQELGEDILDLSAVDADTSTRRDDAFTIVDSFSFTAGELVIDASVPGEAVISGDVDGDGNADITIRLSSPAERLAGTFDNNLVL